MKTLVASTMALFLLAANAPQAQAQPDPHGRKQKRWSVQIGSNGIGIQYERGRSRDHYPQRYDRRHWVEGRWIWETRRVQDPGRWDRRWVPARFEWRYDHCGRSHRVCIEAGHYERFWVEGCWRMERFRRWIPGRWIHR